MNKINSILEYPELRMDFVRRMRLGSFWNNTELSGQYWRLYHNDSRGAGVYWNRKSIELLPEKLYLLQPQCGLHTWCVAEPIQLYLHFEVTQIIGNSDHPITEIEISEPEATILRMLYHEIEDDPWTQKNRTKMLAASLAAMAMAELPEESFIRFSPDARIASVCDHIRTHLALQLNIGDLACRARMSVNSFLRNFKDDTGMTPHRYLLSLRYSRAAQMLETTDISIDEICDLIGVNDRFHFSRTFKSIYGISPGRYRENREKLEPFVPVG